MNNGNRNHRLPPITVSEKEKRMILRRFERSKMSNFSEWGRRKLSGVDDFGIDWEAVDLIKEKLGIGQKE